MKKTWHKIATIAVVGVIAFIGFWPKKGGKELPVPVVNEERNGVAGVVVEVKGEVKRPGLYILDIDSRVNDLIFLAGGFTANADTAGINLAAKLSDGMVVYITAKSEEKSEGKISINSATIEELMQLPGIGESRARGIVDYRNKNGRFNAIEDLTNVNGISKNILEQIKEFICL